MPIFELHEDAARALQVPSFGALGLASFGKLLLGVYIQRSSISSSFGAVGSLVALLVWVYVSSQIFFLGVEFTAVWAQRVGRSAAPETPP